MTNKKLYIFFIFSLCFAVSLAFKGFAGFDLSPMISLNNAIHKGFGYDYFIDNPMPPGFAFIVAAFTNFIGANFLAYFLGNVIFCLLLFVTGQWFLNKYADNSYGKYQHMLQIQLVAIFLPNLLSDGHFYVSDTSNILAAYAVWILEILTIRCFINKECHQLCKSSIIDLTFSFMCAFVLFLKPNIGILAFSLCFFFYAMLNFLTIKTLDAFKKIIFFSSLVGIFILLINSIIGNLIDYDLTKYLHVISEVGKSRFINFGNTSVDIYGKKLFSLTNSRSYLNFFYFFILQFALLLSIFQFKINKKFLLTFLFLIIIYFCNLQSDLYVPKLLGVLIITAIFVDVRRLYLSGNSISLDLFLKLIALASLVIGFILMTTNNDVKSSEFPFVLLFLISIFFTSGYLCEDVSRLCRKTMFIILAIFVFSFMLEGVSRYKLLMAGPPVDFKDFKSKISDNYFFDLHTSSYHKQQLESIDSFLKTYKKNLDDGRIMFGPRLEYIYEKYSITPPEGLPLWWHIGTSYLESDLDSIKRAISSQKIEFIVFADIGGQFDGGLIDDDIRYFIKSNKKFKPDYSYPGIIIYRKV